MNKLNRWLLFTLTLIDLGALLVGIYYYWPQLQNTPWYLWLFVPHSPFYPALAAISLIMLLGFGKTNTTLDWVAAAGMLKYGIWTMTVIVWYGDYFLAAGVAAWFALLFILHVGETAQGIAFAYKSSFTLDKLPVVLGWFLLGDFFDYGLGSLSTHPILPVDSRLPLLAIFTALLSVACTLIVYALSKRVHEKIQGIPLVPNLFR